MTLSWSLCRAVHALSSCSVVGISAQRCEPFTSLRSRPWCSSPVVQRKSCFNRTSMRRRPNSLRQPPSKLGRRRSMGEPGKSLWSCSLRFLESGSRSVVPSADTGVAGFQGNFVASRGDGEYTFTTTVFMPTGSGVATIQCERFGQAANDVSSFFHVDLMPENNVRLDDDENTRFGTFPRDQPFIVQLTLNINVGSPSAQVVLSGAGASGNAIRNISPAFIPIARQFGAIRAWMGFPHTGSFNATNIVVSYEPD